MASLFSSDPNSHLDSPAFSTAQSFAHRGGPVVAVTAKDSVVVLAVTRKRQSRLQGEEATRKVWTVDDREKGRKLVFAFSGFVPDAKQLLKATQKSADSNSSRSIEYISDCIAEVQYAHLSSTASRPLAVSSLLCGFDAPSSASASPAKPQLFHLSPSSLLTSNLACALGSAHQAHQPILDEKWREGMSTSEAVELALHCVFSTSEARSMEMVEVTVVKREGGIEKLSPAEVSLHIPSSSALTHPGRIVLPLSYANLSSRQAADLLAPSDDGSEGEDSQEHSPLPSARVSRALSGLFEMITEHGKAGDDQYSPQTDHVVLSGIVYVCAMVLVWGLMNS